MSVPKSIQITTTNKGELKTKKNLTCPTLKFTLSWGL